MQVPWNTTPVPSKPNPIAPGEMRADKVTSSVDFTSIETGRNTRSTFRKNLNFVDETEDEEGERYKEECAFYEANLLSEGMDDIDPIPYNIEETDVDARLKNNLLNLCGFRRLNPLQTRTIPVLLSGKNLLVKAPTGIGKTAAFLLPAVQMIINHKKSRGGDYVKRRPLVMIVGNTANLAKQSLQKGRQIIGATDAAKNGINIGEVKITLFTKDNYGHDGMECDLAIGTTGSILNRIKSKELDLSGLQSLIIDEADKMLETGAFGIDISEIYGLMSEEVKEKLQVSFFSATYDETEEGICCPSIMSLLSREKIDVGIVVPPVPGHIVQNVIKINMAPSRNPQRTLSGSEIIVKMDVLKKLLIDDLKNMNTGKDGPYSETCVVFVERVKTVNMITYMLQYAGFNFLPVSSAIDRPQQQENLNLLRNRKIQGLVCTNMLARGCDVPSIRHVIIMEMSSCFNWYRHRIGRTGRAGHGGRATLMINPDLYRSDQQNIITELYKNLDYHNQRIPTWLRRMAEDISESHRQ